jgi:hypothetical protein
MELSCTSGEGLAKWYDWLKENITVAEAL